MTKDKGSLQKLQLTLPEYNRIYQVIHSVLEGRANTPFACTFFAAAGALILSEHYRIPARPVAGAFLLCVDPTPSVISIAKHEDGLVTSGLDGFHVWVQTQSHVIDFMAPIFNESINGKGHSQNVPRRMFQRLLAEEADSIEQLREPGDFFTIPNVELTNELVQSMMGHPAQMDLLGAANRWFKKYPKKLDDLSLLDDLGQVHKLSLSAPTFQGRGDRMITLNSERGLVRIESWDDIASVPGFTASIDPKTIKLKEIIGSYTFSTLIPCGLSTCHQPHENGFLVAAAGGRVTNIGRICGKRHFSVEFTQMSRVYLAAVRAQQNREFLWELNSRLPAISSEISAFKAGERGGAWINARVNQLMGKTVSLPMPIVNAVRQAARRGDGALMLQRALTKEERETRSIAVATSDGGRQSRISDFLEEQVGQLDGFSALAPGNGIREVLGTIEPFLATLSEADIDNLPDKQLRQLSKIGAELEPNLERLRGALAAGARLLTQRNIQQLLQFATSRSERKLFDLFLRGLPS